MSEIEKIIQGNYPGWTIGITDDPERRKGEHEADGKDVRRWKDWEADSKGDAEYTETYFIGRGMQGGEGGGTPETRFVYIF